MAIVTFAAAMFITAHGDNNTVFNELSPIRAYEADDDWHALLMWITPQVCFL